MKAKLIIFLATLFFGIQISAVTFKNNTKKVIQVTGTGIDVKLNPGKTEKSKEVVAGQNQNVFSNYRVNIEELEAKKLEQIIADSSVTFDQKNDQIMVQIDTPKDEPKTVTFDSLKKY